MHPLLLLIIVLIFSNPGKGKDRYIKGPHVNALKKGPISLGIPKKFTYFDTFKMELLLDRLHAMAEALEKINHLNQMRQVPITKANSVGRIRESLDAAKDFVADEKKSQQLDTITSTLSGIQQMGSLENIMSTMGPILSMLTGGSDSEN